MKKLLLVLLLIPLTSYIIDVKEEMAPCYGLQTHENIPNTINAGTTHQSEVHFFNIDPMQFYCSGDITFTVVNLSQTVNMFVAIDGVNKQISAGGSQDYVVSWNGFYGSSGNIPFTYWATPKEYGSNYHADGIYKLSFSMSITNPYWITIPSVSKSIVTTRCWCYED